MRKKKIVIALGHHALGTTLPEQKAAAAKTAEAIAGFIKDDYQVVITHGNGPQVGMIHMAMAEFCRIYPEYTSTPMSVCSAMSQGYIGYDLQNAIRTELLNRGIYKNVCTVLTQVVVDPYDDAFYHPTKIIGRIMNAEEAELEERIKKETVAPCDANCRGAKTDRYYRSGKYSRPSGCGSYCDCLRRRRDSGTAAVKPAERGVCRD